MSFSHWKVNTIWADRWRLGNIFLAGDAAHRILPWGALGMNTGVRDANNLVWKVSLALKDRLCYEGLLSTYQTERLPVGRRVGETSLENMRKHSNRIDAAIGVSIEKSSEENSAEVQPYFNVSHPEHAAKRAAMDVAVGHLDSEFKAPGYQVGWFYPSADLDGEGGPTHGGQQRADGQMVFEYYYPSTIPGHQLPHAWVTKDGAKRALRDLLALDQLTLFVETPTDVDDERVTVVVVGQDGWRDESGLWATVRKVEAVLVRPDGIVAWRGSINNFSGQVDRVLLVRPHTNAANGTVARV